MLKLKFNPKTTGSGLLLIAVAALQAFTGISLPGFNIDLGAAVVTGIGLLVASDA